MRKSLFALVSLFHAAFLGCAFFPLAGPLSAQTLTNRPLAEVIEEARAHFDEQSYALALPLFAEWKQRAVEGSAEALEARFFELYCEGETAGTKTLSRSAVEDLLHEAVSEAHQIVQRLKALGPPAISSWLRVTEACIAGGEAFRADWDPLADILHYWGQSTDLESARGEYLRLLWKAADEGRNTYEFLKPDRRAFVRNAARIAKAPGDVARFNLFMAKVYGHWGIDDADAPIRRGEALERAVNAGPQTEDYAESLWLLAQWAERYGSAAYDDQGERAYRPDYVRAQEAYERLAATTREDWAGWRQRAVNAIARLERPDLQVLVGHAFRPETEVQFAVRWRNLEAPAVEVYKVDPLGEGFLEHMESNQPPPRPADQAVDFSATLAAEPGGLHFPILKTVRLERDLPPAAYVVVARSGEKVDWAPLFVTNLVIVTHRAGEDVIAYVGDADDGRPRKGLKVAAEYIVRKNGKDARLARERLDGTTDENGLWVFKRPPLPEGRLSWSIVARSEEKHGATVLTGHDWRGPQRSLEREAYLMTDRSIYRPGDTVRLCGWLRQREAGDWQLPDVSQEFNYRIASWRNGWEQKGELAVNQNGRFTLEIDIPKNAPLGSYGISIEDARNRWHTPYQLFNVEEYRTPEIEAAIAFETTDPLQPGDAIEGSVSVDYFAGGSVEDATVELVVTRTPFQPVYVPHFDEPWFFDHLRGQFAPSRPEEVTRLTLGTDARGKATFTIPTDRDAESDWTYTVEARVRDLSRRETVASAAIKVTRQAYFASLELGHKLIAPKDRAELTVHLEDANQQPVSDDGVVRIMRERWREIYVHRRRGSEISGEAYRELPDRSMISAARSDYRLRESGFVTEEVARFELATDASGTATLSYEPPEEGYYKFEWFSRGDRGKPIRADTPLWVSNEATSEIGYRPGGVQLIADPGPFVPGEPIPLLVTAPTPNRWVLLTISARGIIGHQIVHLEGSSRLVTVNTDTRCQPNCFVDASLISDESHFLDTIELILPPTKQYLDLSLQPDREGYEPGDEAVVKISVRDAEGLPVQTDLVFGASDAALYSLLEDPRVPVRQNFYGSKIYHVLDVTSSLNARPFFKPLEAKAEADQPGAGGEEEIVELNAFEVNTANDLSYRAANTVAGTRMQSEMLSDVGATDVATGDFSPALRQKFQSTLHWAPLVTTDAEGEAEVTFTFPDNLTAWRMQAVAIDAQTRVGEAEARTTTRLPLVARLQTPRFLTERDTTTVTGVVQNNTQREVFVTPELEFDGPLSAQGEDDVALALRAGRTERTDWLVKAEAPGTAKFRLSAATAEIGDAVERPLTIFPHGIEKTIGLIGRTAGDSVRLKLSLPAREERGSTQVHLALSTSLAPQLLGALPFLIDYPYGCAEQTISRFLPAVAVRRAAHLLGQPLEGVDGALFASLTPAARGDREDMRGVLDDVTAASLERLAKMQKPDGSFPWMPEGISDPYMTAYAVWTLTLADEVGIDVSSLRIPDARSWLERALIERDLSLAERTWILLSLASRYRQEVLGRPSRMEARVFLDLMNQREHLAPMSLAMLALTARYYGFEEDTGVLLNNLANTAQLGEGTIEGTTDADGKLLRLPVVHWGQPNQYFDWSEGAVESTAWVLAALLAIDPQHPWVEPAVNWLSRNRTGTHWSNTRATAFAVLALTDYLSSNADSLREATFTVSVDGQTIAPPDGLEWSCPEWVPLQIDLPESITNGFGGLVEVRRTDSNEPFHYGLFGNFYDRSEDILAASSDVSIQRDYWYLKPVSTLLEGVREVMTPLRNGGEVASGDRVEVVLRLEVPRALRYVLIEDLKPAGLEAVQVLSGPTAVARELAKALPDAADGRVPYGARTLHGHQELRNRRVAFLFDRLPAGTWEIRYRLRAEAPGRFHALPATVEPMYLPHVRGNSAEWKVTVNHAE